MFINLLKPTDMLALIGKLSYDYSIIDIENNKVKLT